MSFSQSDPAQPDFPQSGSAQSGSALRPAIAQSSNLTVRDIAGAAVPVRTLVGLGITFFIVSSIGSLAPEFSRFAESISPLSLLVPFGVTVFFVASAFFVRRQVDYSIFYKILLCVFAAMVLLLAFSIGISAPLVLYSYIIADVMMWTVLALWAKKTPVKPHLVFAFGWVAECIGSTVGQTVAPLLAAHLMVFLAVSIMLILLAVGFAFSEGKLMLDVDENLEWDEGLETEKSPKLGGAFGLGCGLERSGRPETGGGFERDGRPETASSLSTLDVRDSLGMVGVQGEVSASGEADRLGASDASVMLDALGSSKAPDSLGVVNALDSSNALDEADKMDAPGEKGRARGDGVGVGNSGSAVAEYAEEGFASGASTRETTSRLDEFASAYGLSPRECEVLELWVSGRSLKYIEGTLFISESTLKTHLRNIYRKCDTHNRDEVISLYEGFGS